MFTVILSALQHYLFCPRQCAFIHVEQVWEDNLYTERGNRHHARVDTPRAEMRQGIRFEFALPLWSEKLGLIGKADAVEFEDDGTPYPVEHKVGRKLRISDQIQLCAQALCLEEMFGYSILKGALFYFGLRSRKEVFFDSSLRDQTLEAIQATRQLLEKRFIPAPIYGDYCKECSLQDLCLPQAALTQKKRFEVD
ncbi:MAG: CRISPR-associated protein Cas4 [Deinococcaceae bacterium]